MLVFVAGVSVLLTLLVVTEGSGPLVIGVSALLVGAHVLGTLIGTRLRDTSTQVRDWRSAVEGSPDDPVRTVEPIARLRHSLPAPTLLASSYRAPLRDRISAAVGLVVGFSAGLTLILLTIGREASWPGVVVGSISCAVLGGWFAWMATGFGAMARHAWREANSADNVANEAKAGTTRDPSHQSRRNVFPE